jgi:hypothetical protein
MTTEEYKNRLKEIAKEKEAKEIQLTKEYVNANNPYKVGDIVEDHIGKILVEQITITYTFSSNLPCALYIGSELKKDNSKKKNGSKRNVYQTNLKNI